MSSQSQERGHMLEAFYHQSQLLAATVVLFEQAVADQLKLSVSHVHCANLLRLTGPMTAGQLAELTGLTTGAVTSMVDRLERAGYVRREHDPQDRRRVLVHAEAEAMERDLGPLYESLAQASVQLIDSYSDQQLAFLIEHLTQNNALMLDEAVKIRRSAAQPRETKAGIELRDREVSAPLGTLTAGHLVCTTGATRLNIRGAAPADELFHATFGKLAPNVAVEGGLVKIFYRQALLNWHANTADVQLNARIPWQLVLEHNGAHCHAHIHNLKLEQLEINGKASTIDLKLPRPTGSVPIRVVAHASTLLVRCPRETELQIRLQRGATSISLDGDMLDITAGAVHHTAGYAQATERYDLDLAVTLTTLQIERYA